MCFWIFLTNRSSMLLSHWLPDHRAKLLKTTWMSSKTSGRSKSECWQRPWMTSPQWMTSFLSQVITNWPLPRQLEENKIRSILQGSQVSVSSGLLGPLSFHSSLQMWLEYPLKKSSFVGTLFQNTESKHLRGKHNFPMKRSATWKDYLRRRRFLF